MEWLRRLKGENQPRPVAPQPDDDSPERLHEQIADLVRFVNRNAGQLPGGAVVRARLLTDILQAIVDTAAVRPLDVYTVISVRNTVADYLPTTLRRYLAVPEEARDAPRPAGGTPTESLLEQLEDLLTSAASVQIASQNSDADALMAQGAFLSTKFSRSDLAL